MNGMELPLVFFTVLSQLAIGMALMSTIRQFATSNGAIGPVRNEWLVAAGVVLLGLVASLAHLGHPTGAARALVHLGKAWLSREALGVGIFLALTVLTGLSARKQANPILAALAVAAGLLTLLFTGMTYAPPSYPAINNVLPFVFFLFTVCILGSGFGVYFTPESKRPMLTRILTVSLITALVVYLIVPCVWLSGGTVMALTGKAWIGSWIYWLRIVVGLALPLAVLAKTRSIPLWLPFVLLAGELLGRIVFFSQTLHSAANMGGLY